MTKVTDGKEAIAYYEVMLVTADKKTFEVEVSPEGKILNIEEKKEEKKRFPGIIRAILPYADVPPKRNLAIYLLTPRGFVARHSF